MPVPVAALFAVFLAALPAALMPTPAAFAEGGTPDSENGRYSFNQLPEGLLRLDSRTGQVSLCGKRAVGWACQAVPDERTALETEIARLQSDNAALKRELISRGISPPGGIKPAERQAEKGENLVLKLPNEADLDRVMTFFEKVWRRMIDMVQRVQKEMEKKG